MRWSRRRVLLGLAVVAGIAFLPFRSGESAGEGADRQPASVEGAASEKRVRSVVAMHHQAALSLSRISGDDASERMRGVAVLRSLGEEGLKILRDEFADVQGGKRRQAAAFALAVLGAAEDRESVALAFLQSRSDPPALLAAAAAELHDASLVGAFKELRSSADPRVREAVARAFRAARFPPLEEMLPLLVDAEPRVRAVAERTLTGMLPGVRSDQLRRAAAAAVHSGNPRLRVAGLQLCARVAQPWALDLAASGTADSNLCVRAEAMDTLARLGDGRACPSLVRLLERGVDRQERIRAANALGSVEVRAPALDALAKAARRKDPVVALAAARALVVHEDRRGIPALLALRKVEESAELDVDEEDADLLAGLSTQVLSAVANGERRRAGEDWDRWWSRVQRRFDFPRKTRIPEFPANH